MDDTLEKLRLATLKQFDVLDTPSELLFDSLVELAAQTFSAPIALISLIDEDRQWFKACIGLDARYTARNISFCQHAILSDEVFVVLDALQDDRFRDNPLVVGPPEIRFYAGAPLIAPDGSRLGTLCVIDRAPRGAFTQAEKDRLVAIAKSVMQALLLRLESRERDRIAVVAANQNRLLTLAEQMAGVGTWSWSVADDRTTWSDQVYRIHGYEPGIEPPNLQGVLSRYHPQDAKILAEHVQRAIEDGRDYAIEARVYQPDGSERHVIARGACERNQSGAVTTIMGTFQDVTEHVRAERFIRTLTDSLPSMVAYWDKDLRCRFANAAYGEWFERDARPVLGVHVRDFLGDELYAKNEGYIKAALQGERQDFERSLVRPSGEIGYTLATYVPDVDAFGDVNGFYYLGTDITSLNRVETELAKSEARYRRLADNASDIVTESGLDGRFRYVSPAVESMTGFTAEEVVGRQAIDFVHPDDKARVTQEIEASITKPGGPQIEHRHVCKDGRIIWVESRPTLARDPVTGKPFAVTDVLRNITARKEAEAALAATETRFSYLADNASDVIARYDLSATFHYLSPAIEGILGYAPDELIGRKTFDIIHPSDHSTVAAEFARYIRAGATTASPRIEYRAMHKNGSILWFEAHPRALYDADGRVCEFMDIVRDVTARKAMELELEHARAAAEAATVVKSEFLSNMSHELRTPLTSIMGFSSLLENETGLTDQGRRAVARVNGSSQALLTIVNDILDFSKLESGQVEIDQRTVDPDKVLRDSLELLEPQAHAKGLHLTYKGDTALPAWVSMDDGRVRQILLNLLSNALKFTAEGGATLTARYDTVRQRLRCEVNDTGAGIPPNRLDRLFKRFSQVDASTTRAFGGTGLGLAICKGLVEAMGGAIGVTSEPGMGSCFWFELPCPPAATPTATIGNDADVDEGVLQGLRVLVADDNPVNRELVRVLLSLSGVELTEVEDGEAAVARANEAPFDVILMDIRMPRLDGPSAARLIREGGGPNDLTPIMAFTANNAEDALTPDTAGFFDGHVAKPISPADLIWAISRFAAPLSAVSLEANHG